VSILDRLTGPAKKESGGDTEEADEAPTAIQATAPAVDVPAVTDKDHIRGKKDASVVLIEYSDFECPFCGRHHPNMKKLLEEFPNDVAWVYRHFPLSSHPEAKPAAIASECAGEQGKFWEYTDALFENQSRLGEDLYAELALTLRLNTSDFKTCLTSGRYDDFVAEQEAGGVASGVTGTPATFVNGKIVAGALPYATIKSLVETELAGKK
jgi:protein-disulfide isomerase